MRGIIFRDNDLKKDPPPPTAEERWIADLEKENARLSGIIKQQDEFLREVWRLSQIGYTQAVQRESLRARAAQMFWRVGTLTRQCLDGYPYGVWRDPYQDNE